MEGSSFTVLEIVSKLWQQSLCHISRGRKVRKTRKIEITKKIPLKVKYDVFLKKNDLLKKYMTEKGVQRS